MPDLQPQPTHSPLRSPATSVSLTGLGTAHPPNRLTQRAALEMALPRVSDSPKQRDWTTRRYQNTGIDQRYTIFGTEQTSFQTTNLTPPRLTDFYPQTTDTSASPGTAERLRLYADEAPVLAALAARRALIDAQLQTHDIDHLVTVSCTGMSSPGVDLALIQQLDLRSDISRTLIGFMGCHGAINGFHAARSIALAHPGENVLLVCVEICTLHFQHGFRPSQIIANSLFGDASAAAVLKTRPDVLASTDDASADGRAVRLIDTTSDVLPGTSDAMTWTVTDHGFEMTLDPGVPESIRSHLRPWLAGFLQRHGLQPDDVTHWLLHPGGPRILDTLQQDFALSADQIHPSRQVLRQIGNVSSATVLFVLQKALQQSTLQPGPAIMLAFGPGLTMEAAIFDLR